MKKDTPIVTLHGRTMTADMAEISGFGGTYEQGCRAMVLAGVEWMAQHDGCRPRVSHPVGVIGVDRNDNIYAEQLTRAMLDAPIEIDGCLTTVGDYGATGAMVQFSKQHALRAAHLGWEFYCTKSRERR